MWEFDTEFWQVMQRTREVKSFRFPVRESGVSYRPGQYFFLTIKIQGKDAVHHFSFSSSPTEKGYIEFTKRITEHEFSRALASVRGGEWAHLMGPLGEFVLPETKQKLAFLSGGIGITPLRSMLRCIADEKEKWDIALLYGNASADEIIFRDELDAIAEQNPGIRVVHVLAGREVPPGWKGKTGLINKNLILEAVPDFRERTFYISGPPRMVLSLEDQLLSLNLSEKQLKRDSFTGYD